MLIDEEFQAQSLKAVNEVIEVMQRNLAGCKSKGEELAMLMNCAMTLNIKLLEIMQKLNNFDDERNMKAFNTTVRLSLAKARQH